MSELMKDHHHHHHDGNNDDDNKKRKVVVSDQKTDHDLDEDEKNSKKTMKQVVSQKNSSTDVDDCSNSKKADHDLDEDEKNSKKKMKQMVSQKKSSTTDLDDDDDDDVHGSNSKKMIKVIGDMALDLCLCLPPVSIIRLKSACKYWYEIISDPSFLRNYARRFHSQRLHLDKPPGILLCPRNIPKHSVYAILPLPQDQDQEHQPPLKVFLDRSLPAFKQRFPHAFIVDSCNGLLLYCETTNHPPDHKVNYSSVNALNYKIHNPLLNQFMDIPRLDHHHLLQTFKNPDQIIVIENKPHIVFDPSSLSPSYKVLVMLHEPPSEKFQVHVYFSETEKWRHIKTIAHDAKYAAHWETTMFDGAWYCLRDDDLFYFDDANHTVSFIQLPQKPQEDADRDVFYFGECGGRLQLIQEYNLDDHWFPFRFTIMELKKPVVLGQQPTWFQKFRVEINSGYDHLIDQGENEFANKVMHPYETEEGDEAVLLSINNQKLVSYNITTETFGKELTIPYFESYDNLDIFPFTPTLFPLYKLTTL